MDLGQKDFVDDSGSDAETELRGIHAPEEGESYVDSYYGVLEAVEKNTVYVADSQQGLPSNPDYDSVVGVAESTVSGNNDRTLHIYDGTEWVDTFEAVDDIEQELDARVTANEGDISELQGSIGDADSDLSSLEDRVDVNEDNIASLDSRVSSTESDIISLESDVSNNAGEIGTLQRAVSDNTSDISDLDSRVSSNESNISSLSSRVSGNESDISDLQNAVGNYDVDNLDSRISSNESDISSLESDVSRNESNISSTESRVDSLEEFQTVTVTFDNNRNSSGSFTRTLFKGRRLTMGRWDFQAYIDDPSRERQISRQHFRLWYGPNGIKIRDVDSLNGTWVNGTDITDQEWHDLPHNAEVQYTDHFSVNITYEY